MIEILCFQEEVPLDNDSDIFAEEGVRSDPTGQVNPLKIRKKFQCHSNN
jgi:hypothetical protein